MQRHWILFLFCGDCQQLHLRNSAAIRKTNLGRVDKGQDSCAYEVIKDIFIATLVRRLTETKCINKAYNFPLQRENTALARSLHLQIMMNQNRSVCIICTKAVVLKVGCDCSKSSLFAFSEKLKAIDVFHRKGKL